MHDPRAGQAGERAAAPAATCSGCGARAEQIALTWTASSGPRGTTWLCERCTRENLRALEGRLDEAWW